MSILTGWRYCPRCRSELEGDVKRVECPQCGFVAYGGGPVPTATAVVVDEGGRVLLGRRAIEPDKGLWDLPGGFIEDGEHPLDAVRRELREESGLEIEPLEFLGVWMDKYGYDSGAKSTLNMYWSARIVSGTMKAADDVAELRWFPPDELPSGDELAFEVNEKVLSAWLARQQDA